MKFLLKNKKYLIIGAVIIFVLVVLIKKNNIEPESFTVTRGNVEESIMFSGKIMNNSQADLGFASSGRIARIPIKNNEQVTQGAVLAQLEIGDLLADLRIKQLNLQSSNLGFEDAKEELEKVTAQENEKVESAYRKLLSDGLALVAESDDNTLSSPVVSGFYSGAEGQYKIVVKTTSSSSYELITTKLENTKIEINKQGSTELGTKGLYLTFPVGTLSDYSGRSWYLDIPNKSSSSYLENLNLYNEAKRARDLAIKDAEFNYKQNLNDQGGSYSVAQAEIDKINADIRKNTIYAPFTGKVTNIEKEVGESAGVGERIISILGEDTLEVVLQVPELDVSKIIPGQVVKISIDSIPGEYFYGEVKTINSRETEIDGVPVYEAFVQLNQDIRIKTGMSANGLISLNSKNNVLYIPIYLTKKINDRTYVDVFVDGKTIEKEINLGLVGSDKMVEIISGLNEGEKILSTKKQ